MLLHLELPDTVVALLGEAPERTIYRLIKAHLAPASSAPKGRPVANTERDAAIADKALAGATHAAIANEYGLSTIRVSQIAVQGKAAALIRNPPKEAPIHNTEAKPKRPLRGVLTDQNIADILRMRSEGALQSEIMAAFSITMEKVQSVLWSAPPAPEPSRPTERTIATHLHGQPRPSHDFEFDLTDIFAKKP